MILVLSKNLKNNNTKQPLQTARCKDEKLQFFWHAKPFRLVKKKPTFLTRLVPPDSGSGSEITSSLSQSFVMKEKPTLV
jgi:hypothetical protein